MDQSVSFEENLESDIARLASEIKTQRERPELQNAEEREIVKEAIRAFPVLHREHSPSVSVLIPVSNANASSPLPEYAQQAPAEVKLEIEYLLDVALKKGMSSALGEAQKASAFVQDAFHDALAGRLYPELQRRGMVK